MIKVPAYFPTAIDFSSAFITVAPQENFDASNTNLSKEISSFTIRSWLTTFYVFVLLLFIFRLIRNLFQINLVALAYNKVRYNGYELILTNNKILPYSFLKRIFVNKVDYEQGKISEKLFMHEIYHIQQKHSLDIIIAEIIQTLFWFNPVLIFHNRAIRLNHEYLADQAVLNKEVNTQEYQNILLEAVSNKKLPPITSGFSAVWTKKRLLMMAKRKSVLPIFLKTFLAIPIVLLITVSFIFSPDTRVVTSEKELSAIFKMYPNFYGTWNGKGRFMNTSLSKEVGLIPFQINVRKDKTIVGSVGDAILSEVEIMESKYGIEIQALLSQPVSTNEKIEKDRIILLWVLPEIKQNIVEANFHLKNNFFFDPYMNVGGVLLTKSENNPNE